MGPDLDTDGCTIVDNVERMEQKTKRGAYNSKYFILKKVIGMVVIGFKEKKFKKNPCIDMDVLVLSLYIYIRIRILIVIFLIFGNYTPTRFLPKSVLLQFITSYFQHPYSIHMVSKQEIQLLLLPLVPLSIYQAWGLFIISSI